MMRVLTGGRLIDGTGAGPVDAAIVIQDAADRGGRNPRL